jgi:hypothetical protein
MVVGRHRVFYEIGGEVVMVLAVIDSAMDVEARLHELRKAGH